jgi:3-ketosteroid 9alpha-monooxygenase subunit B
MPTFYCAGRRVCCRWPNAACCNWCACDSHPARTFWPGRGAACRGGNAVAARITLHGKQHAILLTQGSTLLNALERQGVQPPSHCRAGVCGTCRCKVSHGRVSMRNNQVLTAEEVASGWALACQAQPLDSTLHVSFDEAVPAVSAPTSVIRSVAWEKTKSDPCRAY